MDNAGTNEKEWCVADCNNKIGRVGNLCLRFSLSIYLFAPHSRVSGSIGSPILQVQGTAIEATGA